MGCTGEVNFGKMRGSLQLLTVNEARLGFFGLFICRLLAPYLYSLPFIKDENSGFYSTSDVLHLNAIT